VDGQSAASGVVQLASNSAMAMLSASTEKKLHVAQSANIQRSDNQHRRLLDLL